MTTRTLGIDLGGCMSGNSAYAFIEWNETRPKIITLFKEPKHKDPASCATFLKEQLQAHRVDAIAVDAPFSIPKKLIDPGFIPANREAQGEISNPYLFRYTDYWLYRHYGLRVMPPAGDRIGRLTARMIELLNHYEYNGKTIILKQQQTPIYEVYPKQIALALGYKPYKQEGEKILQTLGLDAVDDEHLLDAVLCSYCAYAISQGKSIHPPKEAEDEGWCYPLHLH